MRVTVIGKNIDVTPALKEIIEKKILKLERYFTPEVEARATLSVQKNRQILEVTIPFNGIILRCEESTDDMYKSIDLVQSKLERQIRKQRTKLNRNKIKNNSFKFAEVEALAFEDNIKDDDEVVKIKKFNVKPMTTEEAMLQIDLVGHNFFVFKDADTNNVNVLYKRKDGNYGLLEPEYL